MTSSKWHANKAWISLEVYYKYTSANRVSVPYTDFEWSMFSTKMLPIRNCKILEKTSKNWIKKCLNGCFYFESQDICPCLLLAWLFYRPQNMMPGTVAEKKTLQNTTADKWNYFLNYKEAGDTVLGKILGIQPGGSCDIRLFCSPLSVVHRSVWKHNNTPRSFEAY